MRKPVVFMIMPFDDEFFDTYGMLKERFAGEFDFSHAGDDVNTQQSILKDIVQMIYNADVIIADLTNLNANVFYELGIAHTLNKKVIVITKDISQLPFDIKSYRALEYSIHFKRFENLIKELGRFLRGAIDGSVDFGNPVIDFLATVDTSGREIIDLSPSDITSIHTPDGFLDYMADIEDRTKAITLTLTKMNEEITEMSTHMTQSTGNIKRVSQTGGSGLASYMRKEARKVAEYINICDNKLREHNTMLTESWPTIEKSCIGLIGNSFAGTDENKAGLITFLGALYKQKTAALGSLNEARGMLDGFASVKGIQKELNQAVNSLELDMKQFMEFVIQMSASIDRIISKSIPVVGIIDYGQA